MDLAHSLNESNTWPGNWHSSLDLSVLQMFHPAQSSLLENQMGHSVNVLKKRNSDPVWHLIAEHAIYIQKLYAPFFFKKRGELRALWTLFKQSWASFLGPEAGFFIIYLLDLYSAFCLED